MGNPEAVISQPDNNASDPERRNRPLEGKVAVITGASRGIGSETAKLLAEAGAYIIATYRQLQMEHRAQSVVQEVENLGGAMIALVCDITNTSDIEALRETLKRYGKVDILIHNAAGGLERDASDKYALQVNAVGKAAFTEMILPFMPNDGIVIENTSIWSHFHGRNIYGPPEYERVARTKHLGVQMNQKIVSRYNAQTGKSIRYGEVCGHIISGTFAALYLNRRYPEVMEKLKETAANRTFPKSHDMAAASLKMTVTDFKTGHVEYVGLPYWDENKIKQVLNIYGKDAIYVNDIAFYGDDLAFAGYEVQEKDTQEVPGLEFFPETQIATLTITPEHTEGHFTPETGISVFPGYKMIAAAEQTLAHMFAGHIGQITGPVEFKSPIVPGEAVVIKPEILSEDSDSIKVNVHLEVNGTEVTTVSGVIFQKEADETITDLSAEYLTRGRLFEIAAQSVGLVFVNQRQDSQEPPLPLFQGIRGPITILRAVRGGEILETEARITEFSDKGFKGNAIIRCGDDIVAIIEGINCVLVKNVALAGRSIQMAVNQRYRPQSR